MLAEENGLLTVIVPVFHESQDKTTYSVGNTMDFNNWAPK